MLPFHSVNAGTASVAAAVTTENAECVASIPKRGIGSVFENIIGFCRWSRIDNLMDRMAAE